MIVVVRVRGIHNVAPKIRHTLKLLRLHKPNHAVVVPDTPAIRGMLKVVKDYVTYGEVSDETLLKLIQKRGEKGSKKVANPEEVLERMKKGEKYDDLMDPVFRLHPPRKGWKSIKKAYPYGALGPRDNMDELLKRMM
ncbi:MAG: 50S ribosomal protein L30 [Candidatus Micrarchaeota archaeon]|nr:50S ribosomal protein L30 [Candidatus Micrarchaeota archaeon]